MKKISAAPAWLDINDDRTRLVRSEPKAKTLTRLFEDTARGIGAYVLARTLNAEGVTTFGPSPEWLPSSISKILQNRAVTGEFQPRSRKDGRRVDFGDPIPDYYPRIISDSLFAQAEIARKNNLINNRGRKGREFTNLFTGLIFCAVCSARMKFFTHQTTRGFSCSTFENGGNCADYRWKYEAFEKLMVLNLQASPDFLWVHSFLQKINSGEHSYRLRAATNFALKANIEQISVEAIPDVASAGRFKARVLIQRRGFDPVIFSFGPTFG